MSLIISPLVFHVVPLSEFCAPETRGRPKGPTDLDSITSIPTLRNMRARSCMIVPVGAVTRQAVFVDKHDWLYWWECIVNCGLTCPLKCLPSTPCSQRFIKIQGGKRRQTDRRRVRCLSLSLMMKRTWNLDEHSRGSPYRTPADRIRVHPRTILENFASESKENLRNLRPAYPIQFLAVPDLQCSCSKNSTSNLGNLNLSINLGQSCTINRSAYLSVQFSHKKSVFPIILV